MQHGHSHGDGQVCTHNHGHSHSGQQTKPKSIVPEEIQKKLGVIARLLNPSTNNAAAAASGDDNTNAPTIDPKQKEMLCTRLFSTLDEIRAIVKVEGEQLDVAGNFSQIGKLLQVVDKKQEAVDLQLEAIAMYEKYYKKHGLIPDQFPIVGCLSYLGNTYESFATQQYFNEAIRVKKQSVDMMRRIQRNQEKEWNSEPKQKTPEVQKQFDKHVANGRMQLALRVASCVEALGQTYGLMEKFKDSVKLFKEGIDMKFKAFGEQNDHPQLVVSYQAISELTLQMARALISSEETAKVSSDTAAVLPGKKENDNNTNQKEIYFAEALTNIRKAIAMQKRLNNGNPNENEAPLRQVLLNILIDKYQGKDHEEVARANSEFGVCFQGGLKYVRFSLEMWKRIREELSSSSSSGTTEEKEKLFFLVEEEKKASSTTKEDTKLTLLSTRCDIEISELSFKVGEAIFVLGKQDEGVELMKESVELSKKLQVSNNQEQQPFDYKFVNKMNKLGQCLMKAGKKEEGMKMQKEAMLLAQKEMERNRAKLATRKSDDKAFDVAASMMMVKPTTTVGAASSSETASSSAVVVAPADDNVD